jgi:hypothetical protein
MGGVAERLVDVTLHVGVKGDHLPDGHGFPLVFASVAKQSSQGSNRWIASSPLLLAMTVEKSPLEA